MAPRQVTLSPRRCPKDATMVAGLASFHCMYPFGALQVLILQRVRLPILALSLLIPAACTKEAPVEVQQVPKGVLVAADSRQIVVSGDGFVCSGAPKPMDDTDRGRGVAITGWLTCERAKQ